MTKDFKRVPIKHGSYTLHETRSFVRAFDAEYDRLSKKYDSKWLDDWTGKIYDDMNSLKNPGLDKAGNLGTIDAKNYSKNYAYRHVPDTEMTLFFKVDGNDIHFMTCGWSRSPWPEIFKEKNAELAKNYEESKAAARQSAGPQPQAAAGGDLDDDPEARRQAEYRARAEAAEAKHDKAMDDKAQTPAHQPDQKPGQGQDIDD